MANHMTAPLPTPDTREETTTTPERVAQWRTVVHNDPVNLMSYVQWVFMSYFGMSMTKARNLMLAVHEQGRAVVSHGQREQMEADAHAMHGFGLLATIEEDAA